MLKTLEKTTWDEIKVLEIFAWEGCWAVCIKLSEEEAQLIECDLHSIYSLAYHESIFSEMVNCYNSSIPKSDRLYKLPKATQHLWLEV